MNVYVGVGFEGQFTAFIVFDLVEVEGKDNDYFSALAISMKHFVSIHRIQQYRSAFVCKLPKSRAACTLQLMQSQIQ